MPLSDPRAAEKAPSLLVAYPELDPFLKARQRLRFRSWVLDSGAYSVLTSGVRIDLHEFTDRVGALLHGPGEQRPERVFALDVIGDPEASAKNVDYLWASGVRAVPTFHYGSPPHYLADLKERYPEVAIGGLVQRGHGGHGGKVDWRSRVRFCETCFARLWPKWIHGFGCSDSRLLNRFPFSSTDSTTWCYGAARYGAVQFLGSTGRRNLLPQAGSSSYAPTKRAGIRMQIEWHLDLEHRTRLQFGKTLRGVGLPDPYQLRLAVSGPALEYFTEREPLNAAE